jgi:phosphatidate cytidylyltransferase
MSYLDEPDDEYRAADGRSDKRGRRGGRRATEPARPAWDAATYGRLDDTRRPARRSARPAEDYPSDSYTSDSYPSDRFSTDSYPTDSYSTDSYSSDSYSSDSYSSNPYPASPYPPEAYPPDAGDGDLYGQPRGADMYPAGGEPYSHEPYSGEPYSTSSGYPTAAYPAAPDSYAPDRYTSFDTGSEPEHRDEPEQPPTYVASGLYLDAEAGGPGSTFAQPVEAFPGGHDQQPPAQRSKGGRNLPAAIGVGVGLGALVLASLFLWRPAFLAVVVGAVGVGIWELVRAVRTTGVNPPLIPLLAGGALMMGLAWWGGADGLTFGLAITIVAAMVWRFADGVDGYARDVTMATFVAVYVPFLAGFAAMLASPADGDWRVIVTLAAVVLSDTGGYIVGAKFGRHAMAPSVSPKKSWEGLAGSLGATAIGSAVLLLLIFDVPLWWGLLFGLAVSAASVVGDLGESMIKRDLGVKDMSSLLPGHGGLMDRLDSILFAAPTAYLVLSVIAPV